MKYILTVLCGLCVFALTAQVNIGTGDKVLKAGEIDDWHVERLLKSKTIFVYRESDKQNLEQFKKVLQEAWGLTTLVFVSYDEFREKDFGKEYSFCLIESTHLKGFSQQGLSINLLTVELELWMRLEGEKYTFWTVDLFHSAKTHFDADSIHYKVFEHGEVDVNKVEYAKNIAHFLYSDAEFYNWNTVFLKNVLQYTSRRIEAREPRWRYKKFIDIDLSQLSADTLYVPEDVFIYLNRWRGQEESKQEPVDVFSQYKYPYKVVAQSELERLVLDEAKPVLYLSYIKGGTTHKFVSVINSATGDFIYTSYRANEYNLDKKDLKILSGWVKSKTKVKSRM